MTLVITNLLNTPDETVTHVYIPSGASDYSATVIQNASALLGGGVMDRILSVKGCLVGFTATIQFDQSSPFVAEVLPNGYPFEFNTSYNYPHGEPINNPQGSGTTGNISLTTTGLTTSGSGWFIITTLKELPVQPMG